MPKKAEVATETKKKTVPAKAEPKKSTKVVQKDLPPVKELFVDAWDATKKAMLNLVLLVISYYGAFIAAVIVFMIIAFAFTMPVIAGIGNAADDPTAILSALSGIPSSYYWMMGILFVLYVATIMVIAYVFQGAQIISIGKADEDPSFGAVIKASFSKVIPLFLFGIVASFLVLGGYMLFIIPGIIIAFMLAFAIYEIMLEDKGIIESINTSFYLVGKHFGAVFGRWMLFVLLYIGISLIPSMLGGINETLAVLYSPISFVVSILVGFFAIAFGVTLYKQVKAATPTKKADAPIWAWIVSSVGFLIFILMTTLIVSGVKTAMNEYKGGMMDYIMEEVEKEMEMGDDYSYGDTEMDDSDMAAMMLANMSPEEKKMIAQSCLTYTVNTCEDGYVRVESREALDGAGFMLFGNDIIECPVVSPDQLDPKCVTTTCDDTVDICEML